MENIEKNNQHAENPQPEFFKFDEDGNAVVDVEFKNDDTEQEEKSGHDSNSPIRIKHNDGLDFNCEVCGDQKGGCPQCGFGRNR